jgi:hypothetical protein
MHSYDLNAVKEQHATLCIELGSMTAQFKWPVSLRENLYIEYALFAVAVKQFAISFL